MSVEGEGERGSVRGASSRGREGGAFWFTGLLLYTKIGGIFSSKFSRLASNFQSCELVKTGRSTLKVSAQRI